MSFKIKTPSVIFKEMKEDFSKVYYGIKTLAILLATLCVMLAAFIFCSIITAITKFALLLIATCFMFF